MNSQERDHRLREIIAGYLEAEEAGQPRVGRHGYAVAAPVLGRQFRSGFSAPRSQAGSAPAWM